MLSFALRGLGRTLILLSLVTAIASPTFAQDTPDPKDPEATSPCDTVRAELTKVTAAIVENEAQRSTVCGEMRLCKQDARLSKRTCKMDARTAKFACIQDCKTLSGRDKRLCKRQCRDEKRMARFDCRRIKSEAVLECREENTECRALRREMVTLSFQAAALSEDLYACINELQEPANEADKEDMEDARSIDR